MKHFWKNSVPNRGLYFIIVALTFIEIYLHVASQIQRIHVRHTYILIFFSSRTESVFPKMKI